MSDRAPWWRRVATRTPNIVIGQPGNDYLRRWYLIPRNHILNVYLHEFCRSDDDRALHDHPWWNFSFILEGSYVEHTIAAGGVNLRKVYRAGNMKFRAAKTAHRIEIADDTSTWSLFITGPKLREWGFHCANGWRHWRDFTSGPRGEHIGRGCD